MAIVEARHLRRQPGGDMDTIGDMPDGHGVFRLGGVQALPHGSGNLAVQRRDSVGAAREQEPKNGHTEGLMRIAGTLAAKAHEPLVRDAQLLAQGAQVLFNEIAVEAVVTSGYRGGGGEDHFPRYLMSSGVEVQAFFLHAIADGLQHGKTTVPFVEMEHSRRNAHGLQGTKATDAEEQLLPNAGASVAAIEARREVDILRRIAGHI